MGISTLKTGDKGHELAVLQIFTELHCEFVKVFFFLSTESDFMAGKCSFKGKQWEASSQMQKKTKKKTLNQAEFSTSVANAPTLSPLIEPKHVLLSSWIYKAWKGIINSSFTETGQKHHCVHTSTLCDVWWRFGRYMRFLKSTADRSGRPFCQSSLKFLFAHLC